MKRMLMTLAGAGVLMLAGCELKGDLHREARAGNDEAIKVLVEAGADVNAADNEGETPLHWAAWNGHVEAIKVLLNAGANPNAADKYGHTPLHNAALRGHVEAIKVLLNAGAEVNADGKQGTPLAWAKLGRDKTEGSIKPYQEVVRLLREAGAE